jgi:hypothetical protein
MPSTIPPSRDIEHAANQILFGIKVAAYRFPSLSAKMNALVALRGTEYGQEWKVRSNGAMGARSLPSMEQVKNQDCFCPNPENPITIRNVACLPKKVIPSYYKDAVKMEEKRRKKLHREMLNAINGQAKRKCRRCDTTQKKCQLTILGITKYT